MIVTSNYTEGPPQSEGRRWVRETHITDEGDEQADTVRAAGNG